MSRISRLRHPSSRISNLRGTRIHGVDDLLKNQLLEISLDNTPPKVSIPCLQASSVQSRSRESWTDTSQPASSFVSELERPVPKFRHAEFLYPPMDVIPIRGITLHGDNARGIPKLAL